jgi:N-glycosylase/DNA lyase
MPQPHHGSETVTLHQAEFPIRDYDLAATLNSGQAFRWQPHESGWVGVIGNRWVRLESNGNSLRVQTAVPASQWDWLTNYLQTGPDMEAVLGSFPDDAPMRSAVEACRGLRLLRQDPWECLASFILSSTKQILQIRQIVGLLCERYGEPLAVPDGHASAWSFPSPARLARVGEADLRACKMGFRAPYLLETARVIATGELNLEKLKQLPVTEARQQLVSLPGVGRKIADCVLLFAYGFQDAFPVDVWVRKALKELYFPRRRPTARHLQEFAETHFGPNAGYAQQYLFHYMRTRRPVAAVYDRRKPARSAR